MISSNPLTIRSVELVPIVVPLAREYRGSYYGMTNRATLICRITTEEGITGVGYAGDEDKTLRQIGAVIRDEITPIILQTDAFAYERRRHATQHVTYDQLRDRRIALVALACVDFAIWDAIGQALELPLWRLWGGFHDWLPVNIIGGYYGTDIRDEIGRWKDDGYRGCKFKIGGRSPREDADRVRMAREVAGDNFVITIDANQGYCLEEALAFCSMVTDLDIRWFEEPCLWSNDRRDMAVVRSRSGGIPICAGQSEYSPAGCRDLMEAGAIDVCNFDASWGGGATTWLEMASLACSYSVQLAHHEEPQIALHLLASQRGSTYLEVFDAVRDPIWWSVIVNRPELVEGHISPPERPGLGWDYDLEFIECHSVDW